MSKNKNRNRNNQEVNKTTEAIEEVVSEEEVADTVEESPDVNLEDNAEIEEVAENDVTEEIVKTVEETPDPEVLIEEVRGDEVTPEVANDTPDVDEVDENVADEEPVIGSGWWVQINQKEVPPNVFNIYIDRLEKADIKYKVTGSGIFYVGPYASKELCIIGRKNIIRRGLKGTIVEL